MIYLVECAVQVTPCGEENESRFQFLQELLVLVRMCAVRAWVESY